MSPFRSELRAIWSLSLPAVITQFANMMLGVCDTLMVGNFLGTTDLGAAQLGTSWVNGFMLFGMGIVFGMDPIVSQAHGANDQRLVARALHWGAVAALIASIPIGVIWCFAESGLRLLDQDPELSRRAAGYVSTQVSSIPAFLLFTACRQYLQGRGILAPAMWIVLVANVFNAGLNWVLIEGHLGAPALGLEGAGYATAATRWLQFFALVVWIRRQRLHEGAWVPWDRASFNISGLRRIFRFGIPTGILIGLELWAFQAASLMSGLLGDVALAAHGIVINLASLSFMVPLGIAMGACTRVGNLSGAGDTTGARRAAFVALGMGAGVMTFWAMLFIILRDVLPAMYLRDRDVIDLAATILPIAAAFQLMDGTQVVGFGVLRGLGRPRPAAVINAIGYWILALPFGYWLTFKRGFGLAGIWWALAFGLTVVAVLLLYWIWRNDRWHGVIHDDRAGR